MNFLPHWHLLLRCMSSSLSNVVRPYASTLFGGVSGHHWRCRPGRPLPAEESLELQLFVQSTGESGRVQRVTFLSFTFSTSPHSHPPLNLCNCPPLPDPLRDPRDPIGRKKGRIHKHQSRIYVALAFAIAFAIANHPPPNGKPVQPGDSNNDGRPRRRGDWSCNVTTPI